MASETKQYDQSKEAKTITEQYNSMLEKHLAEENIMRANRLKIEAHFAACLRKYDAGIGDKKAEYEAMQKKYDQEKVQMDELQHVFYEQDEKYTLLMTEKGEEEQRISNEMANQFLINKSARKIQRYWRAYRERKLARKKKRSKKNSKRGCS